jgi:hypothetical protein
MGFTYTITLIWDGNGQKPAGFDPVTHKLTIPNVAYKSTLAEVIRNLNQYRTPDCFIKKLFNYNGNEIPLHLWTHIRIMDNLQFIVKS